MGLLYSKMKVFHFKEKIDSLPRELPDILPPLHIRIKPTNICNHNCWYCAYRAENLQLGEGMSRRQSIPRDKMLEIISDCEAMDVKAVTFSGGGDPLCYPHLSETIRKLSETRIAFATLTNGEKLCGEIAEIFAARGKWVRISTDGWDDESYSAYRRVPTGTFTKVMKNIEAFKKLPGPCLLGLSLVVDKKNAPHVFDFLKRAKDMGVDSIKVSPCIVSNDGKENNAYHHPFFNLVKEQVEKGLAELHSDQFTIFNAYHELDEKFTKDYDWCPYLQILHVIGADLTVYSCQDKAYNELGSMGSIKNISFREFWLNDKSKFFQIVPRLHCNHHCVSNTKNKLLLEYLDSDREHLGFV